MRIVKRKYKTKHKKTASKKRKGKRGGRRSGAGRKALDVKLSNYGRCQDVFNDMGVYAAEYLVALVRNEKAADVIRMRAAQIIVGKIIPDLKSTDLKIESKETAQENDEKIIELAERVLNDDKTGIN